MSSVTVSGIKISDNIIVMKRYNAVLSIEFFTDDGGTYEAKAFNRVNDKFRIN